MQQNNRNHAQIFLAGVALRHFSLQVLHEAVCKSVKSALAASIFLVTVAAVRTDEFNGVLLRIAVQSRPASAAHPDRFGIMPFHGKPSVTVLRSLVNWIHVLVRKMRQRTKTLQKALNSLTRLVFKRKIIAATAPQLLFGIVHISEVSNRATQKKNRSKTGEPQHPPGVQENEDARTSHPCESRAGSCKATCNCRRGKFHNPQRRFS